MYFDTYQDVSHQWRWRLKAANHKIIADSGESYVTKQSALYAINLMKLRVYNAPVN